MSLKVTGRINSCKLSMDAFFLLQKGTLYLLESSEATLGRCGSKYGEQVLPW
jgi:hypothetical protein